MTIVKQKYAAVGKQILPEGPLRNKKIKHFTAVLVPSLTSSSTSDLGRHL